MVDIGSLRAKVTVTFRVRLKFSIEDPVDKVVKTARLFFSQTNPGLTLAGKFIAIQRAPSRRHVRTPLSVENRTGRSRLTLPSSHSVCAAARVACPQRATSPSGVNQRRAYSGPFDSSVCGAGSRGVGTRSVNKTRVAIITASLSCSTCDRGRTVRHRMWSSEKTVTYRHIWRFSKRRRKNTNYCNGGTAKLSTLWDKKVNTITHSIE